MLPASIIPPSSSAPTTDHSRRALEEFQKVADAAASHLVFAPGRVNLIGEYTDFNGGFVLPLAIELGIYIAARKRNDRRIRMWSTQFAGPPAEFDLTKKIVRTGDWSNYVRGVAAGFLKAGHELPGFDAVIHASLPTGGGLSSSAALEVATATLGEALTGVTLDPVEKALLCQKAEHEFAGTPCGIMDQFAVIFGKAGHLLLIDCRSLVHENVPMRGGDASLLVINTMVKHELTDGGYASRRDDCFAAAELLGVKQLRDVTSQKVDQARSLLPERLFRRARHIATENERTLEAVAALRSGAWSELGALMYASHVSLRDDLEVSCQELDTVVKIAREIGEAGGVYGCRMTGGGFGGCCVAFVRTERASEIAKELRERYGRATGLDPTIFSTAPANGATVLPLK